MAGGGLTDKQKLFIKEYLIDLNATQAAVRAGYSKKNADKIGPELLGKTRIKEAIKKAMDKRSDRLDITADNVLRELALIGFSRMKKYSQWGSDGVKLKDSESLTEDEEACIAEVSETATGLKFKLHDKKGALELLGKHLGIFTEKMELTGANGGPIETKTDDDQFFANLRAQCKDEAEYLRLLKTLHAAQGKDE